MARDFHRDFLSRVKKAITAFSMLEQGDRVAVGVSGGKDSISLLHVLTLVGRSAPVKFQLEAVYIDLGWSVDTSILNEFCRSRGVTLHVIKMDITATLFGDRPAENPCALCAHLRRGVLHSKALELGCNKVALGHHL
ncbi:MAG: ATP-binding protein, partial [Desulfotomaculaceae bacterium]|nr:ATP-binding protein [Desulfotomaculaceae bacterium]